jgi:deazaflavin-dependent oxidoreductase (nitroreductase family)
MDLAAIGPLRDAGIRALKLHQFVYQRSGGRVGHHLFGIANLLLYTVGAKTGRPRASALSYARDGDSYVVVASMGGAPRSPGWYHNLRARPDVEIQIGTRRMPAHARPVVRGDADYDRLWELVNRVGRNRYTGYQRHTTRPIPVVVLTPARLA